MRSTCTTGGVVVGAVEFDDVPGCWALSGCCSGACGVVAVVFDEGTADWLFDELNENVPFVASPTPPTPNVIRANTTNNRIRGDDFPFCDPAPG